MSVFTPVSKKELCAWLTRYSVGKLVDLQGIEAGIDNSNFFVTTENSQYILTLFERLTENEVDYYLKLMAFLGKNLPCAKPVADHQGSFYHPLNGKLASLIVRLPGKNLMAPSTAACEQLGDMLARLHIEGQHYPAHRAHPRGLDWCDETASIVRPYLNDAALSLLEEELAFQQSQPYDLLPSGIIHADLFRDNVLFEGNRITGIIDFYFSGWGNYLFDLAVTVNDWCMASATEPKMDCYSALMNAYCARRPLIEAEKTAWPAMLRLAALRFWLSRIYDKNLPREGTMVLCHNPEHFENMLRFHISQPIFSAN